MSVTAAAALWTLITVSYGGQVSTVTGLPSEAACEDARSIATSGVTVAEAEDILQRKVDAAAKYPEYPEQSYAIRTTVTDIRAGDIKTAKCFLAK